MLQKLFGFDSSQHKVRTEIYAGITTLKGIRQISPTVWVLFAIFVLRYVQKSL